MDLPKIAYNLSLPIISLRILLYILSFVSVSNVIAASRVFVSIISYVTIMICLYESWGLATACTYVVMCTISEVYTWWKSSSNRFSLLSTDEESRDGSYRARQTHGGQEMICLYEGTVLTRPGNRDDPFYNELRSTRAAREIIIPVAWSQTLFPGAIRLVTPIIIPPMDDIDTCNILCAATTNLSGCIIPLMSANRSERRVAIAIFTLCKTAVYKKGLTAQAMACDACVQFMICDYMGLVWDELSECTELAHQELLGALNRSSILDAIDELLEETKNAIVKWKKDSLRPRERRRGGMR